MNTILKYLDKANPRCILDAIPDIWGLLQEREYRKMEKLGSKLGIPIPGMHCRRQIFMDGEEIFDSGFNRSDTVNRNYYNAAFTFMNWKALSDATFQTASLSLKDTGGNIIRTTAGYQLIPYGGETADVDARDPNSHLLATAGSITNGIVIGTNSGAEDFEDFALGAIIANGSAAGEMDYSQSELHAVTNSTLTLKDTLIRDFNNNSGGSITVEEVGIYVGVEWQTPTNKTIMITRDLTGGDAVGDAAQYRYTYESTLVFPS